MTKTTQRMLALQTGKRISLKLDEPTWQAIDWLASQQSRSWQQWCSVTLKNTVEGDNMTAALREAAMNALLTQTVIAARAEQHPALVNHPLVRESGTLDDTELSNVLSNANISGRSDFGGFEVIFGFDEHGQDCVWIQNGLRHGLHFAFVVPPGLVRDRSAA